MSETRVKAILDYLRKSLPKDLSIEELAKATGIGRDTVSKYVYSLEKEGKIKLTREVGPRQVLHGQRGKGLRFDGAELSRLLER